LCARFFFASECEEEKMIFFALRAFLKKKEEFRKVKT